MTQAQIGAAIPIHFGSPDRPLAGWLHLPPPGTPRSRWGLVLCGAFGFEEICSHRFLRHVAQEAAAQGVPAIRFDYDGTGDSAGHEFEPDRVAAWLGSVDLAIDHLRAATGAESVALGGLRLGALLAAAVARRREDTRALALVLPVVDPRIYLRELQALHTAVVNPVADDVGDGDQTILESVGYLMTEQTVAGLRGLGRLEAGAAPVKNVLVVDREDFPVAKGLADALQTVGAHVQYELTRESELILKSPNTLALPAGMLEACARWLTGLTEGTPAQANYAGLQPQAPASVVRFRPGDGFGLGPGVHIREVAEFITPGGAFAVTAMPDREPAEFRARPPRGGLLLLNSGGTHHIGPSRLYVEMARLLAGLGYVVMRLDMGGIGDSPTPEGATENVVYCGHAMEDIRQAAAVLRDRYGVVQLASMGICSGAYHSFMAARNGVPVRNIVLINPLTFYWVAGTPLDEGDFSPRAAVAAIEAQRYGRTVFRRETWLKLVTGRVDVAAFVATMSRHLASQAGATWRELKIICGFKPANHLPTDIGGLIERGIRLSFLFSGTDLGLPRARSLGGAALRRMIARGKVGFEVIEGADHTFMQLKHRRALMRLIAGKLRVTLFGEQAGSEVVRARPQTAPMQLAVRRAVEADLEAIMAFYDRHHARRLRLRRSDIWTWKYGQTAGRNGLPAFVLEGGGAVHGSIGYVTRELRHRGRSLRAAFPADYFVTPDCGGLPAARLLRAVLAECDVAIAVYVSSDARRVLKAAGFADLSSRLRSYQYGLAAPVRSARSVAIALARSTVRSARRLARRVLFARYSYRVSAAFDAGFVDGLPSGKSDRLLRKDSTWFQWRYARSPELNCQYVYQVGPAGPIGIAVVAIDRTLRQLTLVDLRTSLEGRVSLIGLIDQVIEVARRNDCRVVATQAYYPRLQDALKSCLFGESASDLGLLIRAQEPDVQRDLVESEDWNFVLGDSDAV